MRVFTPSEVRPSPGLSLSRRGARFAPLTREEFQKWHARVDLKSTKQGHRTPLESDDHS